VTDVRNILKYQLIKFRPLRVEVFHAVG